MQPNKISLQQLNQLNQEAFTAALAAVFEHSAWVAAESWQQRPFADITTLHQALCATMRHASPERQLALIGAHPDLAGKAALAGELTAASNHEQASAGLDRLSAEEFTLFTRHNNAYRERFAFPFIICVREHTKQSILDSFAQRLIHSPEQEMQTALDEIAKIAWLRICDLVQ